MQLRVKSLLIAGTFALGACATAAPDVDTRYDLAVSFDGYRTFGFAEADASATDRLGIAHPEVRAQFEDAIRRELTSRGFTEESDPSFLVGYHAAVSDAFEIESSYEYYSYRRRAAWIEQDEVREFLAGTLVIDVVDATSNELVWRGRAEGEVVDMDDPGKRAEQIQAGVRRVLAAFPPN